MIVGPPRWKLNPDSDFEAGFKYRIVVTRMEIYETLFVEKLMIDIEGGITNLAWSKKVNMSTLVKNLDIATEQQTFSNIKWINEQSFKAQIQNVPFIARISNDEKQLDID